MKILALLTIIGAVLLTGPAGAREVKRLSPEALARAQAFLRRDARPLDRCRFEHDLGQCDQAALVTELGRFQNEDGGFGRALEPDIRCRESSAAATVEGLAVLEEAGVGSGHAMVQAAVRYLLSTFDNRRGYWPAVPSAVVSAPHAPWWHPKPETGRPDAETPIYPTARVLAFLQQYRDIAPAELLENATASLRRHLAQAPDKLGAGEAVALLRLAEQLKEPRRAELVAKLRRVAGASVARERSEWARYCLPPLSLVGSPKSVLSAGLEAAVENNLDYVIETQEADGGWSPNWSWEDVDAQAWAKARREWRGVLTLENLRRLRAFGRL